jgi:predicted Zn-dependent peptidase
MSVELTTLPSGLRIVTDHMPGLETAAIAVHVGVGSRHESEREHGLSHLLEHMAFKGTRRRSARAIAEEIESAGGDLNAATSTEQTAYYARVLAEDTDLALDILADILIDSTFDRDELEREKSVILQEIGSIEDTPDDLVFDMFGETAYANQPIGRRIIGTAKRVASFDPPSIHSYLKRHYGAETIIVSAAGAVDHAKIVDEARARFEHLPFAAHPNTPPALYTGGDIRLKRRFEQAHIVIGFEGVCYTNEDQYAAHVFTNVVGGGMSSRLFQEVREKRGLAYTIHSFHWSYSDTGLFGFYAASGGRELAELVAVSLDCLAEATQNLDETELARAKAQMKVSLLTALESSSARAEQIARQLAVFGRVIPRSEIIERIDALTIDEVRAAGRRLLRSVPTVAAIGPVSKAPSPDKVAARLGPM